MWSSYVNHVRRLETGFPAWKCFTYRGRLGNVEKSNSFTPPRCDAINTAHTVQYKLITHDTSAGAITPSLPGPNCQKQANGGGLATSARNRPGRKPKTGMG